MNLRPIRPETFRVLTALGGDIATRALQRLSESDRDSEVKKQINMFISRGEHVQARNTATQLSPAIQEEELEKILTFFINKGQIEEADTTVELLKRQLTEDELVGILKAQLEAKRSDDATQTAMRILTIGK